MLQKKKIESHFHEKKLSNSCQLLTFETEKGHIAVNISCEECLQQFCNENPMLETVYWKNKVFYCFPKWSFRNFFPFWRRKK